MKKTIVPAWTKSLKNIRATRETRSDVDQIALCKLVENTVAHAFDIKTNDLRASTRSKAPVALARQVAMYLAHVSYGLTLTQVGRLFKRDRTTASHACRLIEDRRDDPAFDISLNYLEGALRTWAQAHRLGSAV